MLNVNKYLRLAFYTKKSHFKVCHISKTTPPKIMEFRERERKKENIIYYVQNCSKIEIIFVLSFMYEYS